MLFRCFGLIDADVMQILFHQSGDAVVVGAKIIERVDEFQKVFLVSAFAGREQVLAAYAEAVKERYRFFSFGDAMLLI